MSAYNRWQACEPISAASSNGFAFLTPAMSSSAQLILSGNGRLPATALQSYFIPLDWRCAYCGGLRDASAHRCDGCGASRSQA